MATVISLRRDTAFSRLTADKKRDTRFCSFAMLRQNRQRKVRTLFNRKIEVMVVGNAHRLYREV